MKCAGTVTVAAVLSVLCFPVISGAEGNAVNALSAKEAKKAQARSAKAAKAEERAEASDAAKEERAAKAEEKARAREEAQKARAARQAEAAEAKEARQAEAQGKREACVDKRQDNQARRIQHGINKGYLTTEETTKLKKQQDALAGLESSFKADGKITGAEAKTLRSELNEASRCIWAEKHDTDGNQMAAYRLGKNVFAKGDFTAKLADPDLSRAEAKALCKDFHRLVELRGLLSGGDLSDGDREKLQSEYDDLLNEYFEVK